MLALATLNGTNLDRLELARAAQRAEHEFVGTQCGIMDQMTAALARSDHALFIDCRTLAFTPIPLPLDGCALVACDTGVKHELATSAYNTRRAECGQGVELIRAALPGVRALRDVSPSELAALAPGLPETIRKRCRHVVTENARTIAAAERLAARDWAMLGRLLCESHRSLSVDYEVSSPELDFCVELACSIPGVLGARMTGGGFGGCTITLVAREALERLSEALTRGFETQFGRRPLLVQATPADGAVEHLLPLPG
jgi:galactokinase